MNFPAIFTRYFIITIASVSLIACQKQVEDNSISSIEESHEINWDRSLIALSDSMCNSMLKMQNSLGLIETYHGSNCISLYDNALAAIAFTIKGKTNEAKTILNYFNQRLLSELMQGSGGLFQFRNSIGQPYGNRWLGDNAWLLIALNNYQSISGDNSFQSLQYSLDQWIRQQQDVDGGLWGGEDAQGNRIGKVITGGELKSVFIKHHDSHTRPARCLYDPRSNDLFNNSRFTKRHPVLSISKSHL